MPDDRPLLDEVLDYAVFAPLGLALTIVEDLPAIVARGRQQVEGQLGVARFVGKMAVQQARKRFETFLTTPSETVSEDRPDEAVGAETPSPAPKSTRMPSSEGLAIAGYDSLAASQVVARLATLDAHELAAIRAYESATRRRQTILNRIAQIEATHA